MDWEWATAGKPLEPGAVSGDRALAHRLGDGALLALIDGAGHGREAADAAKSAEECLVMEPVLAVTELLRRVHHAVRGTRGCVASVVSVRGQELTWAGVGNVEAVLVRGNPSVSSREVLLQRPGVLGHRLVGELRSTTLALCRGDVVVMASDGIQRGFESGFDRYDTVQGIADTILTRFLRGTDDATVLVTRFF